MSENNRKTISARGEMVDFDQFLIKNQLESAPKTEDVIIRERFVDKKRRKGNTRKLSEMLKAQSENEKYVADSLAKSKKEKEIINELNIDTNLTEMHIQNNDVEETETETETETATATARYTRKKRN